MLVSIDRRKITFEKWIPRRRDNDGVVAFREQESVVSRNENNQTVIRGAGLTIRFEEMFLQAPANDTHNDYVILPDRLEEIAQSVWDEMD